MKAPKRFIGYAFSVGDLLLEVNEQFKILNADGAVNSLFGDEEQAIVGSNFLDYLTDTDRSTIELSATRLTGKNRVGPLQVKMRAAKNVYKEFAVFISQLPFNDNVMYVVVSRAYRLGFDSKVAKNKGFEDEKNKDDFIGQLTDIFDGNEEAEKNLLVTVFDSQQDGVSPENEANLERYLASVSLGGAHAAKLENNRFAVVHERESEDASAAAEKLTADIAKATGITLEAASIDPRVANLSDADNLRALAYSLQRFAEGSDDFTVEKLAEDPDALLGDTRDRVVKFRKLLKESAFSLVYQPIVRLKDGSTSHFEALSRFDQSFAELSPFQIICFAEEVGLIGDYDLAVLNRAVNKLRSIQGSNLPSLAVNVSGRSLSDMKILNEIERSLDAASDLVDNIVLEITESAKIEDLETLGERLEKIRAHGFKVYLDDFGAGASGFQYLRRLKVDAIKIDGEYVREATTRSDDRAFLRAMVGLCKDLNITTVGEWVESRDHAVMLRKIGVDYGQGYYFGKPSIGLNARRIEV